MEGDPDEDYPSVVSFCIKFYSHFFNIIQKNCFSLPAPLNIETNPTWAAHPSLMATRMPTITSHCPSDRCASIRCRRATRRLITVGRIRRLVRRCTAIRARTAIRRHCRLVASSSSSSSRPRNSSPNSRHCNSSSSTRIYRPRARTHNRRVSGRVIPKCRS